MKPTEKRPDVHPKWPLEETQIISFTSRDGSATGVVKEVRWGLVWRDFILEDGRVIPEHKILGCPEQPVWRKADEVSQDEREAGEGRLVSMAAAGVDPWDREQSFWGQMDQCLACTHLRV